MKATLIALCIILLVLQYCLWFADNGILKVFHLKRMIAEQQTKNDTIAKQNNSLASETSVLKKGGTAIENRARNDLGMVKKGEIFYQVVK